jgi:Pyruvate/2-oxoacid:ferredoxin oxidoreductase gamma subunit|tara:strand:- start:105 stop:521 length:417 start_codon:yes stop_codon:yes gene_type:complete
MAHTYEKKLNKALDILTPPISKIKEPPVKVLPDRGPDEANTDYQYARENLYNLVERGTEALDELIEVAKESESPRSYEVVGQLIKTLSDTNKDLLNIQKQIKDIKQEHATTQNITNAVFVGSTAELQKLIKNTEKENK